MASLHRRLLVSTLFGALAPAALVLACGSSGSGASSGMAPAAGDATVDRSRLAAPIVIHPEAGVDAGPDADAAPSSCTIVIDTPELLPGSHVPEGTPITWSSNPPSSGPHYPIWANFQEFDKVVDLGYLVHSMEHGGVVLFTKCVDGPECDAFRAGLRQVRDAVPTDPLCDPSIRVRVVIVPDPLLDVPIAAASWGWTYKADCLDVPSLTDFAKAHVAQGTENLCAAGQTTF